MKKIVIFLISVVLFFLYSFTPKKYEKHIKAWQKKLDLEYKSKSDSPLDDSARLIFKGHTFFPVAPKYNIKAVFKLNQNPKEFVMKTSGSKEPVYIVYGTATFILDNQEITLNIYQNSSLKSKFGYEDYLFLPFTDLSSNIETYGGGRYIDLKIPKGNEIDIDFNKCYNPYCAYSDKYSCPIPPKENFINLPILAGVKYNPNYHL